MKSAVSSKKPRATPTPIPTLAPVLRGEGVEDWEAEGGAEIVDAGWAEERVKVVDWDEGEFVAGDCDVDDCEEELEGLDEGGKLLGEAMLVTVTVEVMAFELALPVAVERVPATKAAVGVGLALGEVLLVLAIVALGRMLANVIVLATTKMVI